MKKTKNTDFYADACAYCDYRALCGNDPENPAGARLPVEQKDAEAAMLRIMNGEEAEQVAALDN